MYKYVFSYGSNLTLERISARTPSVRKVRNYYLENFALKFNKRSIDGSTKANIQPSTGEATWGIIQSILPEDEGKLDAAEGLGKGYSKKFFTAQTGGETSQIFYYSADWITEGVPFDWYLNYVIYGAIRNDFPKEYIRKLIRIRSSQDQGCTSKGFNEVLTSQIDQHRARYPHLWK